MRLAINGFGRIGRNVFKVAFENDDVEVVAINDLTNENCLAHLLKYDSNYGVYARDVSCHEKKLVIDGKEVRVFCERNPQDLPWKELGVDVVVESTGVFRSRESSKGGYGDHIAAGAAKLILTVPAADDITTVVLGVNEEKIDTTEKYFSNASCTTNCLAPVAQVLHQHFTIKNGLMTTIHAYTNDQVVLDGPHSDLRRARNAAVNIIPTETGAAKAIGLVLPELTGKLHGGAIRVPVAVGSLVDLVVNVEKKADRQAINKAFLQAAEGDLQGILRYTNDPIVSSDIVGDPHSAIVDGLSTTVIDDTLVKVLAWYDNEWGYSNRVVELAIKLANKAS